MSKRIILVHGRGKKPAQDEKERLVRSALLHGLGRVSPEAREAVASGGVHLELVYFGDVNNKLIWADETEREVGRDFHSWVVEPLPAAPFDEGLERLFRHETSEQCLDGYRRLRGEFPIRHWLDEAARLVSPVLDALGLSERAVQWWPEIEHYGRSNLVAKNVQGRVRAALERALARDDRVCLVTHSLGTWIAYDVLWELSAGSDSAARRDGKIELFVTLGSPLGESGVRSQLADAGEEAVKYPRNIRRWANFAAEDDVISHDRTLADNFHRMCEQGWVDEISDREVYNLYVHREEDGNLRVDPHRLYGYLDDHQVAGVIADWILRSDEGPAPS